MDIVIDQEDTIYRYRCNEQCDDCPMRYVCYTNKKEGDVLRLKGHSYIDLLMIRGRLDSLIGNQEVLCPWCYRMVNLEIPREQGSACLACGHYITCDNCNNEDCHLRNDLYNIDGDCLMTK